MNLYLFWGFNCRIKFFFTKIAVSILLLFTTYNSVSQSKEIDSLQQALIISKNDSAKAVVLCYIADYYFQKNESSKSIYFAMEAKRLAETCSHQGCIGNAIHLIGRNYAFLGEYKKSYEWHKQALAVREKSGSKKGVASSYNSLGVVAVSLGNYTLAITNYLKSLKIHEDVNDKSGQANCYNNIAVVKQRQGNYRAAHEEFIKALEMNKQLNDKKGMGNIYVNIAGNYAYLGNYPEALKYYEICFKVFEEVGANKHILATVLTNLGLVHQNMENFSEAEKCFNRSIFLQEEIQERDGMCRTYHALGLLYMKGKKPNQTKAEQFLNSAHKLAKELNSKSLLQENCLYRFMLDSIKGNHEGAFKNYELMTQYNDSLISVDNIGKGSRLQAAYELSKKENESRLINEKQEELQNAELQKQKQTVIWLVSVLTFAIIIALFAIKMARQKQKSNIEIAEQNKIIQDKQDEILDSIKYARHIQNAFLPNEKFIEKSLNKLKGKSNA